jgi:hypothetical protein
MNGIRKVLLMLVAALALAAFALPGMAAGPGPQKTYSIVIDTSGATYSTPVPTPDNPSPEPVLNTPVPVTVTVRNESPPSTANSNIGSFTFSLAGFTIVTNDPNHPIVLQSCPFGSPCVVDTTSTLSATGSTITVTNINPPIQAQGTYQVSFSITSCGDGSLANIAVYNGSMLNGTTFKFFSGDSVTKGSVSCGELTCGSPFTVPGTSPTVTGQRGFYDKDGATCVQFGYFVTNTVSVVGGNLYFRWPTGNEPDADPAAAFTYTIAAATNNPQVAWLTDHLGNPIFIPAPSCIGGLPAPYTTLVADASATDKKIYVANAAGLPSPNFDIVIDTERMTVTQVQTSNNQTTLTVTRHVGGTSASSHTTGAPVMSTPLPILQSSSGPYQQGNQAQACLVGQSNGSTTFIDIGDSWSSP